MVPPFATLETMLMNFQLLNFTTHTCYMMFVYIICVLRGVGRRGVALPLILFWGFKATSRRIYVVALQFHDAPFVTTRHHAISHVPTYSANLFDH